MKPALHNSPVWKTIPGIHHQLIRIEVKENTKWKKCNCTDNSENLVSTYAWQGTKFAYRQILWKN